MFVLLFVCLFVCIGPIGLCFFVICIRTQSCRATQVDLFCCRDRDRVMFRILAKYAETVWNRYIKVLDTHPWRTQALGTSVLMGLGDLSAQVLVERKDKLTFEPLRTMRFLAVGLVVYGPGMHLWYSNLDRFIKGSRGTRAIKKLVLDQGIFLPLYIALFIVIMGALRHESKQEIREKMTRDFKPMLMTSLGIWPPVQAVSFYYIHGRFRVFVINIVSLFWNTYLAWKGEQK